MNQEVIQGKWNEIKGEIRKAWGNITGDELEQAKGNLDSISGIIQQRYGQRKEDVSKKLNTIVERFQEAAVRKTNEVKENLRESSDKEINLKN
ncbi:MAG: CsbD family protein [Bdellovibrionaceae bacterium]|nr:CsbD family protein [Pseudobdellovibrionaceae bacterium]